MSSIPTAYSPIGRRADIDSSAIAENNNNANSSKASASSLRSAEGVKASFVSKTYLKGERVNDQSLLGKLRQKLGHGTQLAVPSNQSSGAVFATGVSRARVQQLKSTDSNNPSNIRAADRILNAAKIEIHGISNEQKVRLAILTTENPSLAFEVARRSHGDNRDLTLLLNMADMKELSAVPIDQLVAEKREKLTAPESRGGFGINPQTLQRKQTLGTGHFGTVALYEDPKSGRVFAGKVLGGQINGTALEQEEKALARLPVHDNLVGSYGVHLIDNEEVLLQEYVPGKDLKELFGGMDLSKLTDKQQLLVVRHVAKEIFLALLELQKLGVAHKDVRGANLLWDPGSMRVKLADFGLAVDRGSVPDSEAEFPVAWAAPELMQDGNRRASITLDTFSASRVLIGELVPHVNLFNKGAEQNGMISDKHNKQAFWMRLAEGVLPDRLHTDTRAMLDKMDPSGELSDFFAKVSHPDPSQRMRADTALRHPFLQKHDRATDVKDAFNRAQRAPVSSNASAVPNVAPPNVAIQNVASQNVVPQSISSVQNSGPVQPQIVAVANPSGNSNGSVHPKSELPLDSPYSYSDAFGPLPDPEPPKVETKPSSPYQHGPNVDSQTTKAETKTSSPYVRGPNV